MCRDTLLGYKRKDIAGLQTQPTITHWWQQAGPPLVGDIFTKVINVRTLEVSEKVSS